MLNEDQSMFQCFSTWVPQKNRGSLKVVLTALHCPPLEGITDNTTSRLF